MKRGSGRVHQYAYDILHWRHWRMSTTVGNGSSRTRHALAYDGCAIVHERVDRDRGTGWERLRDIEYIWGPDLSGTLQGAGGVGGLVAVSIDGAYYLPCFDAMGNVAAYLDETGAEVASFTYSAFGETLIQSGSLRGSFPFRFSTKWHETAVTEFCDYGRRWYWPVYGRWISCDPIEEEGGANLYAFCGNGPTFCFDPLGLEIFYFFNQQYFDQNEQANGTYVKSGPDSFENVMIVSKIADLNLATEKTGQSEFHITYRKFDSLSSLIEMIETSSSSDHIIVQAHGAPSGIFFGDTKTMYNSHEMKCFIEALKNHAKTLTLRVCYVSSANAEAIKKIANLESIYYSSTENQMGIGDFGLWPVWDPDESFRILRYEYSPEKSGLQKK